MNRTGVFGMLSLELERSQVVTFEQTVMLLPEGWPEAQLGTSHVPDSEGYLPEDPPATAASLLALLGRNDDQEVRYVLRRGGELELDVYFADYSAFHCWFTRKNGWHSTRS